MVDRLLVRSWSRIARISQRAREFVVKIIEISMVMGEQMLSREYYYLGTQLPIDRFLTFYYGHPGFQINNMMVILSVQVFVLTSKSPHLSWSSPVLRVVPCADLFEKWYFWARSRTS